MEGEGLVQTGVRGFEADGAVTGEVGDAVRRRTNRSSGTAGANSPGDNAAMESFFALLQDNVLDRQVWATREELRIATRPHDAAVT